MKKSRIMALLIAVAMIMSVVPAYASVRSGNGYFVDDEGIVYEKSGANMISNPSFENGLEGLTDNEEYYTISPLESHDGFASLQAIKSTKGDGAITKHFEVSDASASYYLSFWYLNTDEIARRPRVTFAFTDSDGTVPTEENDFTDDTNAWISAGTASNDQDMEYSYGEWVQYSTVLKGNGDVNKCKYVVLNIYGLTKDVAYVDDFELYELIPSDEFGSFENAVDDWKNVSMPTGSLKGMGTVELQKTTGYDNVLVEWSSNTDIMNVETGEYVAAGNEVLAVLTARLYAEGHYDDIYFEYEYPYIVESMFTPYLNWINNTVFPRIGNSVSGNLSLDGEKSFKGYAPATITWTCSEPDVIDGEGNFTEPETTMYVDLTATITCNGESTSTAKRVKALGGNLIPDGLVMYYDFEKEMGTGGLVYDNAQKAYNATSENVSIADGYAKLSGGTIILPTNYPQLLTGSYSVSMWVNIDKAIGTSGGMYRFFDLGSGAYSSQFLRYIPASGQLTFMDRSTAADGSDWAIDTTHKIDASTWKLVSLTYTLGGSPVARAYVDGVEVANSSGNPDLTKSIRAVVGDDNSVTGYIGRTQWFNADNPDLMALLDDVRIYNRALSAEEIQTLYTETRPTITAPVTIKFVDLEGNTLKDDVVVSADVNTTYEVPASYKSVPSSSDEHNRYVYRYLSSQSDDSVDVKSNGDNVCKLVFKKEVQAKGANLIENGSFENGMAGWTNRQGSAITGATVEFDNSIGANVMKIATLGQYDTQNIGTVWNVEIGKEYTISFDIYTGEALAANNYTYNRLTDGFALGDKGQRANSGNDIIAWGESLIANSWTHFEKDFTATTEVLYFQSSWSAGEMKFTNFVLKEAGGSDDEPESDTEKIPVIIKYVDTEGNAIREDFVDEVSENTKKYTVADSKKYLDDEILGNVIYKYTYNDDLTNALDKVDGDGDYLEVSILQDNICTLVYDVVKANKNSNIMVDGGFEDADGNFSWGTWQTPLYGTSNNVMYTNNYFKDVCQEWFYQVNRDTNASAFYPTGVTAEDYALGTRWNDGIDGLCSMANFVPVKGGKTYIVSYDYKHKSGGADASYISTSFQKTNENFAVGAANLNNPKSVTTEWQTNSFMIKAPTDGYIYFHFSWVGSGGPSGGNDGNGPYWYFDNFEILEVITFENKMTYNLGNAEIVAEDGTTGYLVQAMYTEEGELESLEISEELTLYKEEVTKVPVKKGAKLILVKDLVSLEPICPSVIAE